MSRRWSSATRPPSPGSGTSTTPTSAARCASPARSRPPRQAARRRATAWAAADEQVLRRMARNGMDQIAGLPRIRPASAGSLPRPSRRLVTLRLGRDDSPEAAGIFRMFGAPGPAGRRSAAPTRPMPPTPSRQPRRRAASQDALGRRSAPRTDGRSASPVARRFRKSPGQRNRPYCVGSRRLVTPAPGPFGRRPWRRRTERSSSSPATPIPQLAEAIAAYLETPLAKAVVRRFADMEIFVEIQENVRGADVFVLQSTSFPANDHLMELLIIIDALRRSSARRITAVVPYFGYARQDRKPGPRTPISAKLVANLITARRRRPGDDARPARRPDPGLLRHPDRQSLRLAGDGARHQGALRARQARWWCRPTSAASCARAASPSASTRRSPSSTSGASAPANPR